MEFATPLTQGFMTSAGLIIAIGAQNAFVLAQGLTRRFNLVIAAICSAADALLITAGVLGMGLLIAESPSLLFAAALGGALFLTAYSLRSLFSALSPGSLRGSKHSLPNLRTAVLATFAITLLNPHVYLDTVVLVGSIGGRYPQGQQLWFILGACLASVLWFFGLSFGARSLAPLFESPRAWRLLDLFVSLVMAVIAGGLWWQVARVLMSP